MGLQFGIKEVLDVNVVDFKTKEPVFFADYAEASSNEVSAERLDISGGRGNAKLMSFDHTKTSTFTLTLPLVDLKALAMLAGEELTKGAGKIFKREVVTVENEVDTPVAYISKKAVGSNLPEDIKVYKLEGARDNGEEIEILQVDPVEPVEPNKEMKLTFSTPVVAGEELVIYYQYAAPTTAETISVKANKFPKAVAIYGTGLARNQEDEQDYPCHVTVYKARPQSNFTVTMSGTEATNLELTFDLYEVKDQNGDGQYIDYIFETE